MYKEPEQKIQLLKKMADRTIGQVHAQHSSEDPVGRDKILERGGKVQQKLSEIGGVNEPLAKEENAAKGNEIKVPIKGNVQG